MLKRFDLTGTSRIDKSDIAAFTSKPLILPECFTVTAHAGALGLPANTLNALKNAIEHGVDVVEMDVTFRSDGVPVIIHNEKPRKKQGILFDDALKLVSGYERVRINLDLKSFTHLSIIQELAEKYALLNRVFFTGVFEDKIEQVRSECPEICFYLNASISPKLKDDAAKAQQLAGELISLGCLGLNCNYSQITKLIIDVLHENGLLVSVWTVDEELDMYRILSYSVDNITTRNPDILCGIINNWN